MGGRAADAEEVLLDVRVCEILLISFSCLTYELVHIALIEHLIVLQYCKILKILLDE